MGAMNGARGVLAGAIILLLTGPLGAQVPLVRSGYLGGQLTYGAFRGNRGLSLSIGAGYGFGYGCGFGCGVGPFGYPSFCGGLYPPVNTSVTIIGLPQPPPIVMVPP